MTTQETDRAQLRAFALVARAMKDARVLPYPWTTDRLMFDCYEASVRLADDTSCSRRRRVHSRACAHALATAWGL